jgi:hypothetical protein
MIARGMYPDLEPLIEWLCWREDLHVINKSEWEHWRKVGHLKQICEDVVAGKTSKYAADSAIAQHNCEHGTSYTYEDVLGMVIDVNDDFVFSDCGEWALFTDGRVDLLFGDHDDVELAAYNAPDWVDWALLWNPGLGIVVVHKSPYKDRRKDFKTEHDPPVADGLERGNVLSYILPPHEEANLKWMEN